MTVLEDAARRVASELGLPWRLVLLTYRAYWKLIRDTMAALPLKDCDEEGFSRLRASFNVPGLGKLACTWRDVTGQREKKRCRDKAVMAKWRRHDKSEEDQAVVQQDSDDGGEV